MDDNKLIVGLDLCNDFTQISYYNELAYEVESIYCGEEKSEFMIPTALAVTKDSKDWLMGDEALRCKEEGNGLVVTDFIDEKFESYMIYDTVFYRTQLLEKFLRKVLLLLKREFPTKSIKRLVVTIRNLDLVLIDNIYDALENLGIRKDRVHVISHEQSYLNYALSRKKELWMNDIGLFEINEKGLMYYQISMDRRAEPMLVGITTKDYTDKLSYEMVQRRSEGLQYIFKNIYSSVLHKQIISTIYLTGPGFSEEWLGPCINDLCAGRRVFIGQNLYCFGACITARKEIKEDGMVQYAYLSNEALPYSVSMNLYTKGKMNEINLIATATPWYEVKRKFQVILDGETELQFIIRNAISHTTTTRIIALDGIEPKMNRSVRVEIRLECTRKHELIIDVKDVGFGEQFPGTNRIWETIITV
ncbi:MAG: DUF5716 family protein [bacterium]|nr:DUF5716 family protein [bacterium]